MRFDVSTDKVRFVDPDAVRNAELVHTVELSDRRSSRHFVTLFLKGRTPASDAWVRETGLSEDNHHDPAIYHRDDKKTQWVYGYWPDKKDEGWVFHYHVRLDGPPKLSDLAPYEVQIPAVVMTEIANYLGSPMPDAVAMEG